MAECVCGARTPSRCKCRTAYGRAMEEMDTWSWQTNERTLGLAQALRMVRDTCPGVASNIAGRALREAGIEDPEGDDFPAMTAEEAASFEEMESRGV